MCDVAHHQNHSKPKPKPNSETHLKILNPPTNQPKTQPPPNPRGPRKGTQKVYQVLDLSSSVPPRGACPSRRSRHASRPSSRTSAPHTRWHPQHEPHHEQQPHLQGELRDRRGGLGRPNHIQHLLELGFPALSNIPAQNPVHDRFVRPHQVLILHHLKQEAPSRLARQHIGARAMCRNRDCTINPLRVGLADREDSTNPEVPHKVGTKLTNRGRDQLDKHKARPSEQIKKLIMLALLSVLQRIGAMPLVV